MAMTSPATPPSYMPGATNPKPPRRSVPLILALLIGAGAVLVSCLGGVAVGSAGQPKAKTMISYQPSAYPSPVVSTVTKTVQAAPPAPPPPPPAPVIGEGSWVVGDDFPAGTYKAANADDTCYWAIYKPGANVGGGDGIVDNHVGGGSLRVTLQKGQGFTTNRCGIWTKVG